MDERSRLYLEVAEDYASVTHNVLHTVQVKHTKSSESLTLNSTHVIDAISSFVDLFRRNPESLVELRFFTTSEIGLEHAVVDRCERIECLKYWERAAMGGDVSPLREKLQSNRFSESVQSFCKERSDPDLRKDLIERIHWDCGNPDTHGLREELKASLAVLCRHRFDVGVPDGLAERLLYHILRTSGNTRPDQRVLRLGDLYSVIQSATQISVPIAHYQSILEQLLPSSSGDFSGSLRSTGEVAWIIRGAELPPMSGMVPRRREEAALTKILADGGTAVLVGGSGTGKTTLSRAVAAHYTRDYELADLQDSDTNVTIARLNSILGRLGRIESATLVLDDLNFLDARVILPLARLVKSSRRHYRPLIITCHQVPSITTLVQLGLDPDRVVEVSHLSKRETHELVQTHRGDPAVWGQIAYSISYSGHPQLTHAFVAEMATREWPTEQIATFVDRGLTSDYIEKTREISRRSLSSRLPKEARNMLYRLTIVMGAFSRSLALDIGKLPPPVPLPGDCLDALVGPWVESLGGDMLRVSPLAIGFGRDMLDQAEQQRIHAAIVVALTIDMNVDSTDVDKILLHAIVGKVSHGLVAVATSVLRADSDELSELVEQQSLLQHFRTDELIFPRDPLASILVRLAQFRITALAGDTSVSNIVSALFDEIQRLPDTTEKSHLEVLALLTVLTSTGIANRVTAWLSLLIRTYTLARTNKPLQELVINAETASAKHNIRFFSGLFYIGTCNLDSVSRLEYIIDELDKLESAERMLFLTRPEAGVLSGYGELIHGPWAAEQEEAEFDAMAAITRYQRITSMTHNWGILSLSARCWEAQAVLLDEYRNDAEKALSIIDDAESRIGKNAILSRARAKVYRHRGDHAASVNITSDLVDELGEDNPIERAFALRDAAISAAKSADWITAEKWFLEAQRCANRAEGIDMIAMAVALRGDAAVAALEAGRIERSLRALTASVEALGRLDSGATLRSAYSHHMIRHIVLWAKSRITGEDVRIGGARINVEPGACSEPAPPPAFLHRPLGDIDFAWYMLAESEIAAGVDSGISGELAQRLQQGPIPSMEIAFRTQLVQGAIQRLDEVDFAAHFEEYIDSSVYASKNASELRNSFDVFAPIRNHVPPVDDHESSIRLADRAGVAAIMAFVVRAAMTDTWEATARLGMALKERFGGRFFGESVFDSIRDGAASVPDELDRIVMDLLKVIFRKEHLQPDIFVQAGLRFFQWIDQSIFSRELMPSLANWQRNRWERIVEQESFRLLRPLHTVPRLKLALVASPDHRSFVATLLLRGSEAAGVPLAPEYRADLEAISLGRIE